MLETLEKNAKLSEHSKKSPSPTSAPPRRRQAPRKAREKKVENFAYKQEIKLHHIIFVNIHDEVFSLLPNRLKVASLRG